MTQHTATRRTLLAAGAGLLATPALAQSVPFSVGTEKPKLQAPPNATDCHFHIYNDKYPPAPGGLPAPNASPDDYHALQRRIGTTRGVVVQPSLYGTNNSPTLEGMAALGLNFRGVAVVNDKVEDAELQRLHAAGIRGTRFNLAQAGATTPEMMEPLARRIKPMGWHIQINAPASVIMVQRDLFQRIDATLVFDHLAHVPQPAGTGDPAFAFMKSLLEKGNVWMKLSGAYADTKSGPPAYADSSAVARAFAQIAPDKMVWGSDWPHPTEKPDNKPDDAILFDLLTTWVPDAGQRQRVLVDNPARLYDFPRS
ncbi:amidohydrolase family protein [Belnapia sp. F-4-1]|uniref:amidohydrolase family protein n=1 Tax=Belnapia sp. F-4-1 TaxID=1545443 RepID=UPI0005BACCF5|nr:amidohydrolase family protein [Belnapia sp. F-4-1]